MDQPMITIPKAVLERVYLGHILVILKSEYANKTMLFTFSNTKIFFSFDCKLSIAKLYRVVLGVKLEV